MELSHLPEVGGGFVALLLLPTLAVIGLMNRRAIPVLGWTLAAWFVFGVIALYTHNTLVWSQNRFLRVWVLGIGLGAAFLLIAVLRNKRKIKPWVRIGLALITIAVFVRALVAFFQRYA